jgi:hypothetical protein
LQNEGVEVSIEQKLDTEHWLSYYKKKKDSIINQESQAKDSLFKKALNDTLAKITTMIENLKVYEILSFHKNIAKAQRNAYNLHCKNPDFLKNKLLIELDFKQKFVIGLSPRQISSEYYHQIQRSCLGKF